MGNKSRKAIFILIITVITILSYIFIKSGSDNKLCRYLDSRTDYKIVECINSDGLINVSLEIIDDVDWTTEENIQLETKSLFESIKHFPREASVEVSKVSIQFNTRETNNPISKIIISGEKLMTTDWSNLGIHELKDNVEYYYYNPAFP